MNKEEKLYRGGGGGGVGGSGGGGGMQEEQQQQLQPGSQNIFNNKNNLDMNAVFTEENDDEKELAPLPSGDNNYGMFLIFFFQFFVVFLEIFGFSVL